MLSSLNKWLGCVPRQKTILIYILLATNIVTRWNNAMMRLRKGSLVRCWFVYWVTNRTGRRVIELSQRHCWLFISSSPALPWWGEDGIPGEKPSVNLGRPSMPNFYLYFCLWLWRTQTTLFLTVGGGHGGGLYSHFALKGHKLGQVACKRRSKCSFENIN